MGDEGLIMTSEELFDKLDQAYEEVIDLIEEATERGQFNALYFKKPFIKWYIGKAVASEQESPENKEQREFEEELVSER